MSTESIRERRGTASATGGNNGTESRFYSSSRSIRGDDDYGLAGQKNTADSSSQTSAEEVTSSTTTESSSLRRSVDSSKFLVDISSNNPKNLKENKQVQELTINKLDFKSIRLVGRRDQVQTLRSCIDRSVSRFPGTSSSSSVSHNWHNQLQYNNTDGSIRNSARNRNGAGVTIKKKELVLIKGYSGIGKTAVALEGAEEYVMKNFDNGIVGKGKYSLNNNEEPYSGIAAAFNEICIQIAQRRQQKQTSCHHGSDDPDRIAIMGENIRRQVGCDGIAVLTRLIPNLDLLFLTTSNSAIQQINRATNEEENDHEANLQQLKYAFRLITQEICALFSPVVMILDDLQWSDRRSLDVITYLLSDAQNGHGGLTILGLYRSEEVDDNHPLQERIDGWKNIMNEQCNITTIQLDGLSVSDVNRVILTLLAIDDEHTTSELAKVCFRRTFGNPFFLIQFIEMLEQENLLTYNLCSLKWIWDERIIETATMSTANVVSILQAKMKRLPRHCQKLIQLAACLGPSFRVSPLQHLWSSHSSVTVKERGEDISLLLDQLTSEQFLENSKHRSDTYRFVHDMVQESALSLSSSQSAHFRAEIGWILFDSLEDSELEQMIFEVVDLINQGRIVRPNLVHVILNFRAAKKARSLSAFESAASYIARCIGLLPEDKWTNHRDLTLSVFTLGVEMEVALGRDHIMEELVEEVNGQKNLSCLDKVQIFFAKTQKLCNCDLNYAGTVDLSLEVLKDLGFPLPSNPITLPLVSLWAFYRTVKRAKMTPKSVFESPKVMTDPKYRSVMRFLSRVFYASYFLNRHYLLVASAAEMVRLTLDHGISAFSGQAYISLGVLVNAILLDHETSTYFAETAILIQKSLESKFTECQTLNLIHTYIFGWTAPLAASIPRMAESYNIGMQSGNISYACWSLHALRGFLSYQVGKPLSQMLTHLPLLVAQMKDLRQNDIAIISKMWWQLFLTLTGDGDTDADIDDTPVLNGPAYSSNKDMTGMPLQKLLQDFLNSELCLFFGDYKKAADAYLKGGDKFEKAFSSHVLVMLYTFHRGVALFATARRSRKRKYRVAAERDLKTVTRWAKSGNPNVNHYHLLLSAEAMALRKEQQQAAVSLYKQAIVHAGRTGHLHDAGLYNERYADFLRHQINDDEEADSRLREAQRWYTEWGATRVVGRLERTLKPRSEKQ